MMKMDLRTHADALDGKVFENIGISVLCILFFGCCWVFSVLTTAISFIWNLSSAKQY